MTNNSLEITISQARAAYPASIKRIDAAADLVRRHLQNPSQHIITARIDAAGAVTYRVAGSHGETYTTTATSCTCKDCQARRRPCKHVLAVRLLEQTMGRQHGAPVAIIAEAKTVAEQRAERDAEVDAKLDAQRQARRAHRREWAEEV